MQEELRSLSTLQILRRSWARRTGGRRGVGQRWRTGRPDHRRRRPGAGLAPVVPAYRRRRKCRRPGSHELPAATGQSLKGTVDFLRILQREERLQIARATLLTTHPLTPERIGVRAAAARSPYANTPDTSRPRHAPPHGAKLMGFVAPDIALRASRSRPLGAARYARAIAWYRKGAWLGCSASTG
jgi:hypothetical protein